MMRRSQLQKKDIHSFILSAPNHVENEKNTYQSLLRVFVSRLRIVFERC